VTSRSDPTRLGQSCAADSSGFTCGNPTPCRRDRHSHHALGAGGRGFESRHPDWSQTSYWFPCPRYGSQSGSHSQCPTFRLDCASPVDAGHLGSGSRVTVCGRGSGIWLTVVPAGGRHSVLILEHSWQFAAIKVIAAKGAGRAGGAGCRGAAVSGCAGGPGGRRAGDHGGAPVRGGAADSA
jgi:hypothetical protein